MSRRYATIENPQADGTDDDGTGGQRLAFKVGETELGAANIGRLSDLFPKSNVELQNYNPMTVMKATIDANFLINENPEYSEGVSLNYTKDLGKRRFDLFDSVNDEKAKDKPQHGVPNVKVTPEDLVNPDGERSPTESPRRLGGFGTEYKINDLEKGATKRFSIGRYLSAGKSIHNEGSIARLGKSDPAGNDYDPLDRSED